jgi:hypothetical protein
MLTVCARRSGLSRIIKTGSGGKDRKLLEKGIVVAIRELARQSSMDDSTRDVIAYIALSLIAINETIEESVTAWEKRGYWVKADHYRMEWMWSGRLGEDLRNAIVKEDWGRGAMIIAQVTQKLSNVQVPQKNRLRIPWAGSYQRLISPK